MIHLPLHDPCGTVVAYAIVDDCDAHLAEYRWSRTDVQRKPIYAHRRDRATGKNIKLHREVLGLAHGDGRLVDHVNGDALDNRRENLRLVTTAQNAQNQGSRGGTSALRGVSWCATRQRWAAQAQLAGRKVFLGRFDDEDAAGRAVAAFRAVHMPYSTEAKERAAA